MTGDEFARRVGESEKKLYLSALSVLKNKEDAKDAVAGAVAYAWEKLSDLRDESRFDAWLLKITYTEAKKMKKRSHPYEDVSELADAFSYEPQTEELEFFDILYRTGFDGDTHRILTLRFLYGYTLDEIAALMDKPAGTVRTKYYRALKKLSEKLGD